jgi:hypothetical protein
VGGELAWRVGLAWLGSGTGVGLFLVGVGVGVLSSEHGYPETRQTSREGSTVWSVDDCGVRRLRCVARRVVGRGASGVVRSRPVKGSLGEALSRQDHEAGTEGRTTDEGR